MTGEQGGQDGQDGQGVTAVPAEDDLRRRVAALSLEQKVRLLTGADFWALYAEPGAGLRRLVTSDGPAGVRGETWDERDTLRERAVADGAGRHLGLRAGRGDRQAARARMPGARASTSCSPPP